MKMAHGLKTQALKLSSILFLVYFLIIPFSVYAKTLKVDTLTPSVTNGDLTLSKNGTGDILLGTYTGFALLTAGVLSTQSFIDLTSDVSTSVLPIANGGTNSSTALNNDFVIISSAGALVESSTISVTELGYLDNVSSNIQTQLDAKVATSGDESIAGVKTFTGQLIASSTTTGFRPCPVMTEAQRDAIGSPASGDCVVNSDTDKLNYYLGGAWGEVSGSGAGGINYITNYSIDANADGYNSYDDGAVDAPVDGTGGSPSTLTISQNTTTPLRGDGDLSVAKSAADGQGEGVSYDFTIDVGMQAQMLTGYFWYDATNANYTDDEIAIYVYDVTNSNLIYVNGQDLKAGEGVHYFQFQSAPDSTSYRLIFHNTSTNATAYTLYFDEVTVGPTKIAKGAIVTDWKAFTPEIKGTTTDPTLSGSFSDAQWRRVGSNMEIKVFYTQSSAGSGGSGVYYMVLPNGATIDPDLDINVPNSLEGNGALSLGAGSIIHAIPKIRSGGIGLVMDNSTTATTEWGQAGAYNFGLSAFRFSINVSVPIAGWQSEAQMSEDLGGREIGTKLVLSGAFSIGSSGPLLIDFDTVEFDTVSAADTSASNYKINIKESGYYDIDSQLYITGLNASDDINLYVYINGARKGAQITESTSSIETVQYNAKHYLNKGDYVQIYVNNQSGARGTVNTTDGFTWFSVAKRASPQTMLQTERVSARYTTNDAATNNITSAAFNRVVWEDIVYDSHSGMDTSTGVYTAKVTGVYTVCSNLIYAERVFTAGQTVRSMLYKNGSAYAYLSFYEYDYGTTTVLASVGGCTDIDLAKGDTTSVYVYQNSGSTTAIDTGATSNYITIKRIK